MERPRHAQSEQRRLRSAVSLGRYAHLLGGSLFLGCLLFCAVAHAALSNLPREDFWVTDGPVRAIAETNGTIYIGGQFEYISPVSETGHAFDRFSGVAFRGFPKFAGAIKAILNDGEGGWFVGGQFTAAGGYPMTNLAHVHADMTLDTNWVPHPNGAVLALAREGPRLFVGGTFDEIGGEPHSLLAALNPTNGTPLPWRADCTGLSSRSVNALVATNGVLYIGGFFSRINPTLIRTNEVPREHIGSVHSGSGNVTDWFPNDFNGAQIASRIDAMAIAGNLLYVGGTFASIGGNTSSNGPPRPFIAALDVTRASQSVAAWNPGANGPVTALAVECDTVYIAGSFTEVAGLPRRHLAAVAINTGELKPWNPDADGDILSLVPAGNTIYVGGKFTYIGGQPRNFIAALESETGRATFWNSRSDFGIASLAVSGGAVVSGGALGPGGKLRKNAAAFDARTGRPLDWAPQIAGGTTLNAALAEGVNAVAASSKTVYLGGPFTEVNGEARNHIAAVDASTGAPWPWNPDINGVVHALAVHQSVVYAGGQFDRVGGEARTNLVALKANLAALKATNGAVARWNPGANNKVAAIARSGSTVYVGGRFTETGKLRRECVAALNAGTGRATAWSPDANDSVVALAITRSRVYVGGGFSEVGDESHSYLAEVSRRGGLATCWVPEPRLILGTEERTAAINSLSFLEGVLYAGGSFTFVAGERHNRLAGLQLECPATATSWEPDLDDAVNVVAGARQGLAAGGVFKTINGRYRPHFAVFPTQGAPTIVDQPLSQSTSIGQSITLMASANGDGSLSYQWQFNGANIAGANSPTLDLINMQPSNSGEYALVVTNKLGLVNSRLATVSVIEPLTITAQPQSQTVTAGTVVTLNVVAHGQPSPVYQWRLNGVNIPGAVNSTYIITNATPRDGGGYDVVVANSLEALVTTNVANVVITSPVLLFSDHYASNLVSLVGDSGVGSGSNLGATSDPGEPNHAGKTGGSSVWISWTAPLDGVAVFNTRGSSFDTLIGIYVLSNGVPIEVASDEDTGGFQTSQVAFNAGAGTNYLIAIDGLDGAIGDIVLTWKFAAGVPVIPQFISQPFDQSVTVGTNVTFTSFAASAVVYQWFKNCDAIPGATSRTLTLSNVAFDDVGNYRVVAVNASSNVAESTTASLEIGPVLTAFSHDKLEDLLAAAANEESFEARGFPKVLRPTAFVSVSAGTIASQTLNNTRARTQSREPLICNTLGGASKWFGLRARTNGTMVVDTIGSRTDTLLAAYRRTSLRALYTNRLDCNDNGAPDVLWSVVRFDVTNGQDILVSVDGVNGQQGAIVLNWKLGTTPFVAQATFTPVIAAGENLVLTLDSFVGTPVPAFQWRFNGAIIAGATNQTFVLSNAQPAQSGDYSLVLSNFIGSVTSVIAQVTVTAPSPSVEWSTFSAALRVTVAATGTNWLVLESSTNLAHWTPVYTNAPYSPAALLDFPVQGSPHRFFRVRP